MAIKSTLIVSAGGRITLPAPLRKRLGLKGGSVLIVEEQEGSVVLRPAVVLDADLYADADIAEWNRMDDLDSKTRRRLKATLARSKNQSR